MPSVEERFEWYYGGVLHDRDVMLDMVLQMEPDFVEDEDEDENEDENEN